MDLRYEVQGDCWIWTGAISTGQRGGYGTVKVGGKNRKAHIVSYETHRGPVPEGKILRHTCDVRACINPDHLIPGTHSENVLDAVARGRWPDKGGENHGRAKLTDQDVLNIRASEGVTHRSLAEEYGVSRSAISMIISRRSWFHI